MATPQSNAGASVVDLRPSLSRQTFYGGASASATSDSVNTANYRTVALLTTVASMGANTVTAAGVSATLNPEYGITDPNDPTAVVWFPLKEINAVAVDPPTLLPAAGTPAVAAQVYPAVSDFFRLRITSAGSAATGVSATVSLVSRVP